MADSDDTREARNRDRRAARSIAGRSISAPHAPRRYVGQVVAAPPSGSVAPCYHETNPVAISGPDAPGSTAVYTIDTTRTVPVLILGSLPVAGEKVVARNDRGRWVARLPAASGSRVTLGLGTCFAGQVVPAGLAYTITCSGTVVATGTTTGAGIVFPPGVLSNGCTIAIPGLGTRWDTTATISVSGTRAGASFGPAAGYVCCGTCNFPISNTLIFTFTYYGSNNPTVYNVVLTYVVATGQYTGLWTYLDLDISISCSLFILSGIGTPWTIDITSSTCNPAMANAWVLADHGSFGTQSITETSPT
jgi:hypothetical protein